MTESLLDATQGGFKAAQEVLPYTVAQRILEALYDLLKHEPTVVDVRLEQTYLAALQIS